MAEIREWWVDAGRSMRPREAVGQNIARLRTAQGLKQAALAKRMTELGLRMAVSTISETESGARPITVDEAVAFAWVLGLGAGDAGALLTDPSRPDPKSVALLTHSLASIRARIAEVQDIGQRSALELEQLRADEQVVLTKLEQVRGEPNDVSRRRRRAPRKGASK